MMFFTTLSSFKSIGQVGYLARGDYYCFRVFVVLQARLHMKPCGLGVVCQDYTSDFKARGRRAIAIGVLDSLFFHRLAFIAARMDAICICGFFGDQAFCISKFCGFLGQILSLQKMHSISMACVLIGVFWSRDTHFSCFGILRTFGLHDFLPFVSLLYALRVQARLVGSSDLDSQKLTWWVQAL